VFFAQIFQENTFLKTKLNFSLTGKCFPLTNFFNGKQTYKSLENGFPETTFRKTNTAKRENTFLKTKPNQTKFFFDRKIFFVNQKVFSVTNFTNNKQIQKNLKNNFLPITFQKNKHG
jgi:hypothetical protein